MKRNMTNKKGEPFFLLSFFLWVYALSLKAFMRRHTKQWIFSIWVFCSSLSHCHYYYQYLHVRYCVPVFFLFHSIIFFGDSFICFSKLKHFEWQRTHTCVCVCACMNACIWTFKSYLRNGSISSNVVLTRTTTKRKKSTKCLSSYAIRSLRSWADTIVFVWNGWNL